MKRNLLPGLLLVMAIAGSLGCSVGKLLVQVPTPTIEPTKTPRPTYTFTPYLTPTPLPTPTDTLTPIPPTVTPASEPTQPIQVPSTETPTPTHTPPPPPPPANTPAPQIPTDTPTPELPTETPTPEYPFTITPYIHNTGSALETRVTAHVVKEIDFSRGEYESLSGYQVVLVDPLGREHMSNFSGGKNHSTGEGLGDDHWFNTEVKVAPYTSGTYRAWLVKDGLQQSPEYEFSMAGSPYQYIHLDIFWYR